RTQPPEPPWLKNKKKRNQRSNRAGGGDGRAQLSGRITRRHLLPGRDLGRQELERCWAASEPLGGQAQRGRDHGVRWKLNPEFPSRIPCHHLHFQGHRLEAEFYFIRQLLS